MPRPAFSWVCGAVSAAQSNAIHFSYLQGVSAKKLKSETAGARGVQSGQRVGEKSCVRAAK